jgi:hypothetical protein
MAPDVYLAIHFSMQCGTSTAATNGFPLPPQHRFLACHLDCWRFNPQTQRDQNLAEMILLLCLGRVTFIRSVSDMRVC